MSREDRHIRRLRGRDDSEATAAAALAVGTDGSARVHGRFRWALRTALSILVRSDCCTIVLCLGMHCFSSRFFFIAHVIVLYCFPSRFLYSPFSSSIMFRIRFLCHILQLCTFELHLACCYFTGGGSMLFYP